MTLINQTQYSKLLDNGKPNAYKDILPVVKLYHKEQKFIFLADQIISLNIIFGLNLMGSNRPVYAGMGLRAISEFVECDGIPVKSDPHFRPEFPMSVYMEAAFFYERIIEDPIVLQQFID